MLAPCIDRPLAAEHARFADPVRIVRPSDVGVNMQACTPTILGV
jgi:hypothetical protein